MKTKLFLVIFALFFCMPFLSSGQKVLRGPVKGYTDKTPIITMSMSYFAAGKKNDALFHQGTGGKIEVKFPYFLSSDLNIGFDKKGDSTYKYTGWHAGLAARYPLHLIGTGESSSLSVKLGPEYRVRVLSQEHGKDFDQGKYVYILGFNPGVVLNFGPLYLFADATLGSQFTSAKAKGKAYVGGQGGIGVCLSYREKATPEEKAEKKAEKAAKIAAEQADKLAKEAKEAALKKAAQEKAEAEVKAEQERKEAEKNKKSDSGTPSFQK